MVGTPLGLCLPAGPPQGRGSQPHPGASGLAQNEHRDNMAAPRAPASLTRALHSRGSCPGSQEHVPRASDHRPCASEYVPQASECSSPASERVPHASEHVPLVSECMSPPVRRGRAPSVGSVCPGHQERMRSLPPTDTQQLELNRGRFCRTVFRATNQRHCRLTVRESRLAGELSRPSALLGALWERVEMACVVRRA